MSKILVRSVLVACLLVLLAPLSAFAQYGTSSGSNKDDDFVSRLKRENSIRWDGGSIGVNGGIGWGRSQFQEVVGSSNWYDMNGGMFGVSGAYIMRYGNSRLYGGIAADFDWANVRGTASQNCTGCETKLTSFGTLRYVVGYGIPMTTGILYPYLTGGLAVGNAQANVPGFSGVNDFKAGWTVGVGTEYQINNSWGVKAEYLYSDLDSLHCTRTTCGGDANIPVKPQTFRLGVNYKILPR